MKLKLGILALALGLVIGARAQTTHGYGFASVGGASSQGYTGAMLGFGAGVTFR